MDNKSLKEVGKYVIVGIINTVLSIAAFNFFMFITGISAGWLINVFFITASVISITNSFFWNKFWIFRAHDTNEVKKEYAGFFGVTVSVTLFVTFLMHILINVVGAPLGFDPIIWANLALILLLPVSFLGNFLGYKFWVFKKNK